MDYSRSQAKAAARDQFRGVWAAITTPFTTDLEVDEEGLRRNMRHVTDKLGVNGVFCTGVMGEFWALTTRERKRIVEVVVEEAEGKCRVIAHTGHHCALETIELSNHAQEVGADYVILMTPYYPPTNEAMIYDWFSQVSAGTEIGIWLFDTVFSGRPLMSPTLIERLAGLENFCGAKISRTLDHYLAVKRLCGDKLVLSSPSETDFLMMMRDHGQRVHQSSASPFLLQTANSRPVKEYAELALLGDFESAERISSTLNDVRKTQHHWIMGPYRETDILPIAAIKAWSELLGMAGGPVRTPLLQMPEEQRARMRHDVEATGLLSRL
jgi:4-hydroxy-tetrahydrodipicolinate synthase